MPNCKKIEQRVPFAMVRVLALNFYTHEPIPGAKIVLSRDTNMTSWFSGNEPLDTFTTDSKGSVTFKVKGDTDPNHRYGVHSYGARVANGKFCGRPDGRRLIKMGKENNLIIYFIFPTWISYHVKNINPFNNNDQICISDYYSILYQPTYCVPGMSVDTTIIGPQPYPSRDFGGVKVPMVYSVTKNNQTTNYRDSALLPCCDTLFTQITY